MYHPKSWQLPTNIIIIICIYSKSWRLAHICSGHPSGESSLYPATTLESMTVFPSSLYGSSPVCVHMWGKGDVNTVNVAGLSPHKNVTKLLSFQMCLHSSLPSACTLHIHSCKTCEHMNTHTYMHMHTMCTHVNIHTQTLPHTCTNMTYEYKQLCTQYSEDRAE